MALFVTSLFNEVKNITKIDIFHFKIVQQYLAFKKYYRLTPHLSSILEIVGYLL